MIDQNHSRKLAARPRASRFLFLFLLAGLLAVVTPLRADNPPTYLFEIDSSAVPGLQPLFLTLDGGNNVYASDNNPHISRIVKFGGGGMYLTQWGSYGSGNGQFKYPYGIAVDSSNNVYVADDYNHRVEKFDSSGNHLTQWGSYGYGNGQFEFPEGVAVDSSNNVYVVDKGNARIEKFTSTGSYLMQWGSYGSGNGQFRYPFGLAVDRSNNVYVTDSGNNCVEKFDSSGNYLTQWGSFGTNNGQFASPQFASPLGIAVDSGNNVYVVDSANSRVEKFDSTGNYLTQWGSSGTNNGQFAFPFGIAVDRSGNVIYVADPENSRIEVFVNNTNTLFIISQPANQIVAAGANVTFSVGVIGVAPFAYQWNSNTIAVPGATNATFTLTNVGLSASGNYSVLVTNINGSALSSNAVLAVVPAFVTTLPASGISATGAVLNGSVTVGPDETVVWFDWGTDTNYGNITGATIVPGNNGSNNISVPLDGLPGNVYHYRLDAANDSGIVYGEDQSFTVGFAPAATTLPPTNAANGATLNAIVNPEGWDTTVYFQWGTTLPLAKSTPGIDIGAGVTPLNVSSFVPGLSIPYLYRIAASNALGTAFGVVADGDPNQHHYFLSGSETHITLPPGTYIVTAYGAPGGNGYNGYFGGVGAEMSAEFNFSTPTTLTLLVGGGGSPYTYGGGGGGGSFVVEGSTPLVIAGGGGGGSFYSSGGNGVTGVTGGGFGGSGEYGAGGGGGSSFETGGNGGSGYLGYGGGGFGGGGGGGEYGGGGGGGYSGGGGGVYYNGFDYGSGEGGGGGSIIDSSAIAILAEVSGVLSPDDPINGEIIITAVPTPLVITTNAAFGFTNGVFGFNVIGPSGSNVVIQASTDLQTWIPLQTNLLGSGLLYISDPQSTTNVQRFYRAQLSP